MKSKNNISLSLIIAIFSGLIVLISYFVKNTFISQISTFLLHCGLILGAVALWIGVINMVRVHGGQLRSGKGNVFYHIAFFIGLILTLILGVFYGMGNPMGTWLYDAVIVPTEASLLAVLAVSLTYLLTKIINQRRDLFSIVFLITVLVGLFISVPFLEQEFPFLSTGTNLIKSLLHFVSNGAVRGILIGVALGSIATGLRVILGSDRPYGG